MRWKISDGNKLEKNRFSLKKDFFFVIERDQEI